MSYNKNNNWSSFWLDDYTSNVDILTGKKISQGKDYIKMASRLKAVSNFVKIVSGNDVQVQYNNRDESFTDGKTVTISSKINGKSFDSTVGLALHEVSHVKHVARLNELGRKAEKKGNYQSAIRAEELRGRAGGMYVNQTITKTISADIEEDKKTIERIEGFKKNLKQLNSNHPAMKDKKD